MKTHQCWIEKAAGMKMNKSSPFEQLSADEGHGRAIIELFQAAADRPLDAAGVPGNSGGKWPFVWAAPAILYYNFRLSLSTLKRRTFFPFRIPLSDSAETRTRRRMATAEQRAPYKRAHAALARIRT